MSSTPYRQAHFLKIEERFARQIFRGMKRCEVRRDDRDFQKDDKIFFLIRSFQYAEWEMPAYVITHVLRGGQYGVQDGYVVLSIVREEEWKEMHEENKNILS